MPSGGIEVNAVYAVVGALRNVEIQQFFSDGLPPQHFASLRRNVEKFAASDDELSAAVLAAAPGEIGHLEYILCKRNVRVIVR